MVKSLHLHCPRHQVPPTICHNQQIMSMCCISAPSRASLCQPIMRKLAKPAIKFCCLLGPWLSGLASKSYESGHQHTLLPWDYTEWPAVPFPALAQSSKGQLCHFRICRFQHQRNHLCSSSLVTQLRLQIWPASQLKCIFVHHPNWNKTQTLLVSGSNWPLEPLAPEQQRLDHLEALTFGNQKGATEQLSLLWQLIEEDVVSGFGPPFPLHTIHWIIGKLMVLMNIIWQNMFDETGSLLKKTWSHTIRAINGVWTPLSTTGSRRKTSNPASLMESSNKLSTGQSPPGSSSQCL